MMNAGKILGLAGMIFFLIVWKVYVHHFLAHWIAMRG